MTIYALEQTPIAMTLSFRLGKISVRILPSFLLIAALLGLNASDPRILVAWVAVVFVSVLLHELGHAMMGVTFGLQPEIVLHGMGGTTSWRSPGKLSTLQRIAISLAGPGAGFAVAALVAWGIGPRLFAPLPVGGFVYRSLLEVNLLWGALNLLPMLPLDGGNVMTQALNGLTGGRGERPARIVSIVMAAAALVAAVAFGSLWSMLLAGSFIFGNWRELKEVNARDHDAPMRAALEEAYTALDTKDGDRVVRLARPVALASRTPQVRAEALQLLAFGFLLEGRIADADAAIAALPKGYAPHPTLLELRQNAGGSVS